jgi:D-alanyl-D-alanine carboxypeptidase (penicillin-binding protein 5/6)
MRVPVPASLSHASLRKLGAAAVFAFAIATALAAPNPVSGPKSNDAFQTGAAHAILIDADSGSVLFEKGADGGGV